MPGIAFGKGLSKHSISSELCINLNEGAYLIMAYAYIWA